VLSIIYVSILFLIGSWSFQRSRGESCFGGEIRGIFPQISRDTRMNRAHFLHLYSSIMSPATRHTCYILLAFKSQPSAIA
jgi:hypothetical protein